MSLTKQYILVLLVFGSVVSGVCNAAIIRHDFTFEPTSGGGTGHPSILDSPDSWVGYFEYDTDYMSTINGPGYAQHSFDLGHASFQIDLGEAIVVLDEITINENYNTREILFSAELSSGFFVLPVLPEDIFTPRDGWVVNDFSVSLLFNSNGGLKFTKELDSIYAHMVTNGIGGWDWQSYGHSTIDPGIVQPSKVSEPSTFILLFTSLMVILGINYIPSLRTNWFLSKATYIQKKKKPPIL